MKERTKISQGIQTYGKQKRMRKTLLVNMHQYYVFAYVLGDCNTEFRPGAVHKSKSWTEMSKGLIPQRPKKVKKGALERARLAPKMDLKDLKPKI